MGSKIKTIPMSDEPFILTHSLPNGQMRVLAKEGEYTYFVEIEILRSGRNENDWDFQNVSTYAQTFAGTPILIAYVNGKIGDGHNMVTKVDQRTGKPYLSFMNPTSERIVGEISEDPGDIRVEVRDGQEWAIAKGKLWRFYNQELVDKIVRQGSMKVSAELFPDEDSTRKEGAVEIYDVWEGIGVTILGDDVAPAVPGANIHALEAFDQKFSEMKLKVASLRREEQNPPNGEQSKGVKKNMAMTKTLIAKLQALLEQHGTIIAANALDGGGAIVLLRGQDGAYCSYKFDSPREMEYVSAERISPEVKFSASATLEGEHTVELDFLALTDALNAQLYTAGTTITTLEGKVKALGETIEALKAQEQNRRVRESEAKIAATLAHINENKAEAEKFDIALCEGIAKRAKEGFFATMEAADGSWIGASAVESEVMALCMAKQMEFDKAARANEASMAAANVKTLAWECPAQQGTAGPADLYERYIQGAK